MPIVVLAIWSAASGVLAGTQAVTLADRYPYCIATSTRGSPYGPLRSLFELRGTNFYTEHTGYKDSSRWYFHAVLIVSAEQGRRYWNWSILRLRFEPIECFERLVEPIQGACLPETDFLSRLS